MGYELHPFLIVHTYDRDDAEEAWAIAKETFRAQPLLVSPVMSGFVNSSIGFMVWPSGSQVGYADAADHDANLATLIERLARMNHPPRWVMVRDGEEPGDLSAEQGSDGNWTHTYRRKRIGVRRA